MIDICIKCSNQQDIGSDIEIGINKIFFDIVKIMTCMKLFFNTEIYHFPDDDFIPGGFIIVVYVFTINDNTPYIIIKIKTGVNILSKNLCYIQCNMLYHPIPNLFEIVHFLKLRCFRHVNLFCE